MADIGPGDAWALAQPVCFGTSYLVIERVASEHASTEDDSSVLSAMQLLTVGVGALLWFLLDTGVGAVGGMDGMDGTAATLPASLAQATASLDLPSAGAAFVSDVEV